MTNNKIISAALLAATLSLAACAGGDLALFSMQRPETAARLATPANMFKRQIPADQFLLTAYERVRARDSNITVYVEGDGQAWVSRRQPSQDPTPVNPTALHLATRDLGDNVIWLARPCQYTKMIDTAVACDRKYWLNERASADVIKAMSVALDDIKSKYGATGFHLVGYSGGGGVAALLAASRSDVKSLRTVAGNLDSDLFTTIHAVSPMTGSLNPASYAAQTANIPQHHFIGAGDKVVPIELYQSYRRAAGPSTCIRMTEIRNATHEAGWVEAWPQMLNAPMDCSSDQ